MGVTRKSLLIKIIGGIDENAYKSFVDELDENPKANAVMIELNSGGGSAYDALAFYSQIRKIKEGGLMCGILATGVVASAAVLILAAGTKGQRQMTREAWVMVHEDTNKLKGSTTDLEREAKHMRRMEEQWNNLLAECTGTSAKAWEEMHKKTTYLSAEECLQLGLIDVIV